MNSDERSRCSHRLGFPIRKSPDHRLLASSRGLSQLTTSFIACLRQGIHTHALSSLTIKSTSNTKFPKCSCALPPLVSLSTPFSADCVPRGSCITCDLVMPVKIFNCQRTCVDHLGRCRKLRFRFGRVTFGFFTASWWAWVDSNYRPHPYQGCALAT